MFHTVVDFSCKALELQNESAEQIPSIILTITIIKKEYTKFFLHVLSFTKGGQLSPKVLPHFLQKPVFAVKRPRLIYLYSNNKLLLY